MPLSVSCKLKPVFCEWVQFVQMKRHNFTATLATKRIAAVCDAHFQQKDYLPLMR